MRIRMIVMVLALILVFGALFGYKAFVNHMRDQFIANMQPPPVTVSTMTVDPAVWQPRIESTGSLRAVQGVDLTSELGGTITEITFDSGDVVEAGELLVALNTEVEQAQLAGQRAQLKLAAQTLERKRKLRERGLGSEADLDAALAEYNRIQAQIAATEAVIDKKLIEAPFAGKLGVRRVDLGQYLAAGSEITTLQALETMLLDFDLPQGALPRIEVGQKVQLRLDAYPERVFTGQIAAISPKVDAATRSFRVRATLDNAEGALLPGMFGQVRVLLQGGIEVLTAPRTAISYNPYGDFVYVVTKVEPKALETPAGGPGAVQAAAPVHEAEPRLTAKRRNVRTGESRGDQVQILSGLEAGERIVIIGHHKLRPGATLNIDNSHIPKIQARPENVDNF